MPFFSAKAAIRYSDLNSKSYRELQELCRKAKLSTAGKTVELKKRLQAETAKASKTKRAAAPKKENGPPTKKAKQSVQPKQSPADDLICPITLELPIDPVMAEDGRMYEREAIAEYFSGKPGVGPVMSPLTNAPMGRRLVPTTQFKNVIQTLIEKGDVSEELASVWKQKKEVVELQRKAESGDVPAMLKCGHLYFTGKKVGGANHEVACKWYKMAADTGDVMGMANSACILIGKDQTRNTGMVLMGMAAQGGSDHACIQLGNWYARRQYGLPLDKALAIRMLEMGTSGNCAVKHSIPAQVKDAKTKLKQLQKK